MEITTNGVVPLVDENNSVSIKSSAGQVDELTPINIVLVKVENNLSLSQKEQELVRLLCSLSVASTIGLCPVTTGFLNPAMFALNISAPSFDIPDEEPGEKYQVEFDKIKQRTKLSAKGKSPYGPQRR